MAYIVKKHLIAFLIVLVINIPNYLSYFVPPEGYILSGTATVFDPWDTSVYLSTINWAQNFGLTYQNAFSANGGSTHVIYPVYTLLGYLFPFINSLFLYHILNHVLLYIFVFTIFSLVEVFAKTKDFKIRSLIVLIAIFGGGFGIFMGQHIYSPDKDATPFTLLSSFYKPHMLLSLALEIAIFKYFYLNLKSKKSIIKPSILTLLNTLINPIYTIGIYIVTGFYSYFLSAKYKKTRKYTLIYLKYLLLTLPFTIVWSLYILRSSDLSGVVRQNLSSPNFFQLFLGYGIFAIIFILQFRLLPTKNFKKGNIIIVNLWIITGIFLSLSPLGFSRYFLRSLFIPFALIAYFIVEYLIADKRKLFRYLFILLIIGSLTPANILFNNIKNYNNPDSWYYIKETQANLMENLNKNSPPGSTVLTKELHFSNHIPVHTLNKVYVGHVSQTPDYFDKKRGRDNFFKELEEKGVTSNLLKMDNIDYLVIEKDEIFNRIQSKELVRVFENKDYYLFKH